MWGWISEQGITEGMISVGSEKGWGGEDGACGGILVHLVEESNDGTLFVEPSSMKDND